MIASERSQNIIVASVIIIAVVSSGFLVSNAAYFSGSYSLAASLDVSLAEITISNINHTDESVNPILNLTFSLTSFSQFEGNVKITFMGAQATLNGDLLSYTSFSRVGVIYITPEFNEDYVMSDEAPDSDRETILEAETSGIWNWFIVYRYTFIVFDEARTLIPRWVYFNTTMTPTL